MIPLGLVWRTEAYEMSSLFKAATSALSALTVSLPLCPDDPRAPRGPVWLTNVPAAMEFIAAVEVAVIGFFQVCVDILCLHEPGMPYLKGFIFVAYGQMLLH